jgi:hypothetical protein
VVDDVNPVQVDFIDGDVLALGRTNNFFVRAVRGGP